MNPATTTFLFRLSQPLATTSRRYPKEKSSLPLLFASIFRQMNSTVASSASVSASASASGAPVATAISEKLTKALNPTHLDVINESYMHKV